MGQQLTTSEKEAAYLSEIVSILRQALPETRYRLYLFGSRATRRAAEASDVDIGVRAHAPIERELSLAREKIESSNVPLHVDLIDLTTAAETLIHEVESEGIVLWTN